LTRPGFSAWVSPVSLRPPRAVTRPTCRGLGVWGAGAVALGVAEAAVFPPQAATTVTASTRYARARFMSYLPPLCVALVGSARLRDVSDSSAARSFARRVR